MIGARASEVRHDRAPRSSAALLSWIAFFSVGFGQRRRTRVQVARWMVVGRSYGRLGIPHRHAHGRDAGRRQHRLGARPPLLRSATCTTIPHRPRFFAYLSLFTFAMLMLVTADNLVQMFFGWEGVGLASYLLIGFWYQKPSAVAAAMKAFIVNRVGDFGFALGIFLVFVLFGSVGFDADLPQGGGGRQADASTSSAMTGTR